LLTKKQVTASTPMGLNVVYEGFVAYTAPLVFLKLATQADRSEDLQQIRKYVEADAHLPHQ
jgi:hypothetical protein